MKRIFALAAVVLGVGVGAQGWSGSAAAKVITGHVYSRALVMGASGKPIFAEFDERGEVASIIGEATGEYANAQVMSGDAYRLLVQAYQDLLNQHRDGAARGAYVLDRASYESTQFRTFNNQPVARQPLRWAETRSVLVRGQQAIPTPSTNPVLLESPIDLSNVQFIGPNIKSVLVSREGRVLLASPNTIGYRSAYLARGPEQPAECTIETAYGTNRDGEVVIRQGEDALCGPISGAEATTWTWYGDVYAWTDQTGRFALDYRNLPCPGFDFEYTNHIFQKVYYTHFHPRSVAAPRFRYQQSTVYDYCHGSHMALLASGSLAGLMTYVAVEGILATSATSVTRLRFPVDVTALTGWGDISNALVGGGSVARGETRYGLNFPGLQSPTPPNWDYDADGRPDTVQRWTNGEWGVWLSGRSPSDRGSDNQPLPPDFTVLSHSNPDFGNQGLLQSLSADDLRQTDLYVYRVSNGERVAEKRGLNELEIDDTQNRIYVSLVLPTGQVLASTAQRMRSSFETGLSYNPRLLERNTDQLRPGELLKVIAINRKTGYIGTTTTELKTPAAGRIDIPVQDLVLGPPNLKIRAERSYQIESGLTAGEDRKYLIGFEGSGLTSDTLIAVTTEWYDHDGMPLPSDLPGYTGRLAKTVGDRTLGAGIAHFGISPGTRIQLLRLSGTDLVNEHYYVHVNAQPIDQGLPDFGGIGAGSGELQLRPRYYVPVMVPVFDEDETRRRRNALAAAVREGQQPQSLVADPAYRWVYRPEMQFTVYDLEVASLQQGSADGDLTAVDLSNPRISLQEDFVQLLYQLAGSAFERLDPLSDGYHHQLVFAIGEQEVVATIGENQTIQLGNLDHLALLSPTDYLTIQLYVNGDSANVLWQLAFGLALQGDPDVAEISADEPMLDLMVYATRTAWERETTAPDRNITLEWALEGEGGTLAVTNSTSPFGLFTNNLQVAPVAGREYRVRATVLSSDDPRVVRGDSITLGPFKVVPGEPHRIELDGSANELPADDVSEMAVSATVYDQAGNRVSDGTVVTWALDYDGQIEEQVTRTVDGKVTARYKTGDRVDPTGVLVQAGGAIERIEVAKREIEFTLTASQTVLPAGTVGTSTLTIETGAADGTPVDWMTTRGTLLHSDTAISNGRATATLQADPQPGNGIVVAKVAKNSRAIEIQHAPSTSGSWVEFEHAAIVAADAPGEVSVDGLHGPVSHRYINSTTATLRGVPGAELSLSIGGFFTPNAVPVLHLPMNGLEAIFDPNRPEAPPKYQVTDISNGIVLQALGNIEEDYENAFTRPGMSFAFDGGQLIVNGEPRLNIPNDLFVNLRFRPDGTDADQILIRKGNGSTAEFELRLVNGGRTVRATVTTNAGTFSVDSDTELELGRWYIAGLRVRNGGLELGVNTERKRVPIAGTLVASGGGLSIGYGFKGNLDDVKLGREGLDNALLVFGNGAPSESVVVGDNGTVQVTLRATGNQGGRGQTVGLSMLTGSGVAANEQRQDVRFGSLAINFLAGALGVDIAYADDTAGAQEGGLTLATPQEWGAVAEWFGRRLFGEYFDEIKAVADFVAGLMGISDVVTLVKAVIAIVDGRPGDIDPFEVTFAAIGIGVTVLTVFTGGSAAPLRLGLNGIRPVLKELFSTGLKEAIQTGILVGKFLVGQLKAFISNPRAALVSIQETATAMGWIVRDASGRAIRFLFRSVRSLDELEDTIRLLAKADVCPMQRLTDRSTPASLLDEQQLLATVSQEAVDQFLDALFGKKAHAAGPPLCGQALVDRIVDIANDARYGGEAGRLAANIGHVAERLRRMDISLDEDQVKGLIAISYQRIGDGSRRVAIGKEQLDFMIDTLRSRGDLGAVLSAAKKLDERLPPIENVERIYKQLASRNANDVQGATHVLKDIENGGLPIDDIRGFEIPESISVPGQPALNRRWDVVRKDRTVLEYKAWEAGRVDWSENISAEFVKDIASGHKFQWVIHRNSDKDDLVRKMRCSLGDKDAGTSCVRDDRISALIRAGKISLDDVTDLIETLKSPANNLVRYGAT